MEGVQFDLDVDIREAQGHIKGEHDELVSPDCNWCLMRILDANEDQIVIHAGIYLDALPAAIKARAAVR